MKNDLCERTFNFSVRVYNLCKELNKNGINEAIITRQLLRSGTSIGANVEEAQAGQSRADFLSKYNIALKEAGETHYWLKLLNAVSIFAEDKLESLLNESNELVAILTTVVKNTRNNTKVRK